MKIHKLYPSFYNGVTEQPPELALDNQCKEMINCVPDLVNGLHRRPPVSFVNTLSASFSNAKLFHTYDRGEDNEEYLMFSTGDSSNPLYIINKQGVAQNITYDSTSTKEYLIGNIKGLTVQDRTWVVNKDKKVLIDNTGHSELAPDYDKEAFYWLKRGSGDKYNPYNYAVYLDGVTYACNPDKPSGSTTDPATGFEDSDYAATYLGNLINAQSHDTRFYAIVNGSIIKIKKGLLASLASTGFSIVTHDINYSKILIADDTIGTNALYYSMASGIERYNAQVRIGQGHKIMTDSGYKGLSNITPTPGSTYDNYVFPNIKYYADNNNSYHASFTRHIQKFYDEIDFTFDSWDSWGNEASEGWKGKVNKLTDLPKDFPWIDTYVEITGDNNDKFTTYYVKWNGSSWEETRHPTEIRGELTNMPIKIDRTSLVGGIATFTVSKESWSLPRVGNSENNTDPSFVNDKLVDIFFYKNRFGVASSTSVVLTETANYINFYIKTAVDVLDTDPIDLAIVSEKASSLHYVKPFNNSLFVFSGTTQFEIASTGALSPTTVSVNAITTYPMAVDVEPVVMNNSLFFISTTGNKQQLREYIRNEKLTVEGIDLNIVTPNYLANKITKILVNGVLGFVLCCTDNNTIYVYNYKENGQERVQSAWSKWVFLENYPFTVNSFMYSMIDNYLLLICKKGGVLRYHTLDLTDKYNNNKVDTTDIGSVVITSSFMLMDYYPHIDKIGTPKDKILLKKMIVQGTGTFDATVYRKDYDKTFVKSHNFSFNDLDMHISSKVGNVDISIIDNTINDFNISSIILEGLFTPTSKEKR